VTPNDFSILFGTSANFFLVDRLKQVSHFLLNYLDLGDGGSLGLYMLICFAHKGLLVRVALAQHFVLSMTCDNNLSLFERVDAYSDSLLKIKLVLWALKVFTVQEGKRVRACELMLRLNAQCNTHLT